MTSIDITNDGPIRLLTIRNEKKKNAFNPEMTDTLKTRLLEADADMNVRAIVITGSGTDSFSSGHDLQEVLEDPETAGDPVANAAFVTPSKIGTPVIAAVNGGAYAAGFILALNCDLRVAGDNARFCAVGAKIGLVPVGGQLSRIVDVVTYPVAFKLLATAQPMGADEAERVNFVTETCAPEMTVARAIELGKQIAEVSPAVVRAIKTGLRATLSHGLDAGSDLESLFAATVRELPDGDEGVNSFLEKRESVFPDAPAGLQSQLDKLVEGQV